MIIYLYGNDPHRINQRKNDMVDKFLRERDPQQMNVVRLDAANADDAAKVITEMHTSPFLAEKRMVVVNNIITAANKDLHQSLLEKVKVGLPETTIAVLVEENLPKKLVKALAPIHAALSETKFAQHFPALSGNDLGLFVRRELDALGVTIDADALRTFVTSSSSATEASQYISQLVSYVGDKKHITAADVSICLPETATDNLFPLIDAVMARRGKAALELLYAQYDAGTDAGQVMAMLIKQTRLFLGVAEAVDRGIVDAAVMAKQLGGHPFVIKKLISLARQGDLATAKMMHKAALGLDRGLKRGLGDVRTLLELFVAKVVTK